MKNAIVTLNKGLDKIEKVILAISVLTILINTLANAIGRYAFGQSIHFSEEVNQFLIIYVTFVGYSYAIRKGRNIRMTALYDSMGFKTRKILTLIITLSTSVLLMYLMVISIYYVLDVKQINRVSPSLIIPVYLVYIIIPVGLFLASVQYFIKFLLNVFTKGVIYRSNEVPEQQYTR